MITGHTLVKSPGITGHMLVKCLKHRLLQILVNCLGYQNHLETLSGVTRKEIKLKVSS